MPRKIFCATNSYDEPNEHQKKKKPKHLTSDAFQFETSQQNETSHKTLSDGKEQARLMKRKARSIKDKEDINPNNRKASSKVNIHEGTEYNKAQKAIGFAIQHHGKFNLSPCIRCFVSNICYPKSLVFGKYPRSQNGKLGRE
jgi:hypothetical protein